MNLRLDGKITLLSPLSHIGSSHGPDSFLAESIIIGHDGRPLEVFVYSGNGFRGMLRDYGTQYMLEKIGQPQLPLETFYLLFSGGAIGGDQMIDIEQGRRYRKFMPLFSIFGGGVGNQILQGKMNIGAMFPLVKECQRVLPRRYRQTEAPSWRHWTEERSYTRTDDAKNENLRKYLADVPQQEMLVIQGEISDSEYIKAQTMGEEHPQVEKKKVKKDASQQMRYTIEMLAAGSVLYQRIDLIDVTDLELGAFISALHKFSEIPYIGGQNRLGAGLVEIEYEYYENSEAKLFMTIAESKPRLSNIAESAKQQYDEFLKELYDNYLLTNQTQITQLLAGVKSA